MNRLHTFCTMLFLVLAISASPAIATDITLQNTDGTKTTLKGTSGAAAVTMDTLLNIEIPAPPVRYISVGGASGEDKHAVCTGPCRIESILAGNVAATVAFLKCENDTAANTAPGTDTPEFSMPIPGATTGDGFMAAFPVGKYFSNALTCWIVTGKADSDVAEVGANDVHLNYDAKLCAVGAVYPQC